MIFLNMILGIMFGVEYRSAKERKGILQSYPEVGDGVEPPLRSLCDSSLQIG
jgi:hypothetical protein